MEALLLTIHPDDLEQLIIRATTIDDVKSSSSVQTKLALGKTWHALHFLLTGQDNAGKPPLAYSISAQHAVFQHPPFHDEAQQSPVRYNPVVLVSEIEHQLSRLTTDDFRKRYKADEIRASKVYPHYWGEHADSEVEELTLAFTQLQDFYQYAQKNNLAVISIVSSEIGNEKLI